jgi:hypothetical protein
MGAKQSERTRTTAWRYFGDQGPNFYPTIIQPQVIYIVVQSGIAKEHKFCQAESEQIRGRRFNEQKLQLV